MKEQLKKLLKVKTIITLMVVVVYCYLAVTKAVPVDQYTTAVMMILTYFFNKDNVDKYTVFKTHNGYFEYCLSNEHNGFTVLFSNNYNLHEHSIKGTLIYDGKSCNSKVDSVILNKPSLYIIKTK